MSLKRKIIAALEAGPRISPDVAAETGMSTCTASAILAQLAATGVVERHGKFRTGTGGRPPWWWRLAV